MATVIERSFGVNFRNILGALCGLLLLATSLSSHGMTVDVTFPSGAINTIYGDYYPTWEAARNYIKAVTGNTPTCTTADVCTGSRPSVCIANCSFNPNPVFHSYSYSAIHGSMCSFGKADYNPQTNQCGSTLDTTPGNQPAAVKNKSNGQPKTCSGNPINTGSGNKYQDEVDYVGSGPFPLELRRTYNSQVVTVSSIGTGWSNTYEARQLITVDGTHIDVSRPDQKRYAFAFDGTSWTTDPDVKDTLEQLSATEWRYTTADGDVELYDATGLLTSITNRQGLTQTVTRNGGTMTVTDPFGRSIAFQTSGNITTATLPDGRHISYALDGNANLVSVTYPGSVVRQYVYEDTTYIHALTGIIDEKNKRFATWTYDVAGRAITSEHAGGVEKVTLAFSNDNNSTTVTDALGHAHTQNYTIVNNQIVSGGMSQPPGSGCASATSNSTYDANGNPSTTTDFNGNVTTYTYDLTRNLETSRVEATGKPEARTLSTEWHPTLNLPARIAVPGRITKLLYNGDTGGAGVVTCGTHADGSLIKGVLCRMTEQATLDADGTQGFAATVSGSSRIWNYAYNKHGVVNSIDGPRTDVKDVTTFTYYPATDPSKGKRGNVATITNARGHVTHINSYNANGQPLTIVDPNGLTTTLTYDNRGRITARSVGGETTSYTYDAVGNLTSLTLPDGSGLTYTYDDAHRLTQVADSLGNTTTYTLNLMSNITATSTYDPAGSLAATRTMAYDGLNRLYQSIGAQSQTTGYFYDANGNLTKVTDPNNHSVNNAYDGLDRLVQMTAPDGGVTQMGYNGVDQLTGVSDPRGLLTTYDIDGYGRLKKTTSPDTGVTGNTYDPADNLLTRLDARKIKVSYTYDALNRVTGIKSTQNGVTKPVATFTYDAGVNGIGHLTGISDNTGQYGYAYDQHGRITSVTRSLSLSGSAITSYSYDSFGRLIGMTYPSGRQISYTLDSLGRINAIASNWMGTIQNVATGISYDAMGRINQFTYGNGVINTRHYDHDGRPTDYTLGDGVRQLTYDAAGRLTQTADYLNSAPSVPTNQATYGYDAMDRLISLSSPTAVMNYSYDVDGNRTSQLVNSNGSDYTYNYTYPADSNRLTSTAGAAQGPLAKGSRNFSYNANGSLIGDATYTYGYDAMGRLNKVTATSLNAQYQVNVLGQRVQKTVNGSAVLFHYDAAGNLISESTASGYRRDYIYMGGIPIAVTGEQVATGGSATPATMDTLNTIEFDHLGTPRVIRNKTGAIVWKWDGGDAFGSADPNEDLDGNGRKFTFNQRFPGQYYDNESKLHYNGFRDYDPVVGRYIQSDPIGLAGGMNTYGYVGSNPYTSIDSSGLAEIKFSVFVGVGGGVKIRWGDGSLEVVGSAGAGFGGGFSYDPNQKPTEHVEKCKSGAILRTVADVGAGIKAGGFLNKGVSRTVYSDNLLAPGGMKPTHVGKSLYDDVGFMEKTDLNDSFTYGAPEMQPWKLDVGASVTVEAGGYTNIGTIRRTLSPVNNAYDNAKAKAEKWLDKHFLPRPR